MFDIAKLQNRCMMSEEEFESLGELQESSYSRLIYIDRGASILGVAHLDSFTGKDHFHVSRRENGTPVIIWSPKLDNRLGVYIILDLLPKLGVKADVLLTTDEEITDSSAAWFGTEKKYNWMFSLDREGVNAAMYQYETPELVAELGRHDIPVTTGSYSDIIELWHLGCMGINFGNGIQHGHTDHAAAILPITESTVRRFVQFYHAHKEITYPYEPTEEALDAITKLRQVTTSDNHPPTPPWEPFDDGEAGEEDDLFFCDLCNDSVERASLVWSAQYQANICQACIRHLGGDI